MNAKTATKPRSKNDCAAANKSTNGLFYVSWGVLCFVGCFMFRGVFYVSWGVLCFVGCFMFRGALPHTPQGVSAPLTPYWRDEQVFVKRTTLPRDGVRTWLFFSHRASPPQDWGVNTAVFTIAQVLSKQRTEGHRSETKGKAARHQNDGPDSIYGATRKDKRCRSLIIFVTLCSTPR